MRESIFILLVVAILAAFTALRYRKQISGILGLARALQDAKKTVGQSRTISRDANASVPLVNCTKCGVWVPQNKARKIGEVFYCSDECVKMQKTA